MPSRRGRFAILAALLLSLPGCDGCFDDDDDDPLPPTAPSGLAVTLVTSGRIALSWADTSTNETGFRIERSPDGVAWTVVGTAAAGATTYVDRGLLPLTQYFYRVSATGFGGMSAPAGPANATTLNLVWNATTAGGGPTARIGHSAVYDPGNLRMIVFGGDDGVFDVPSDTSLKNDAWALDLSTATPGWSALTVSGTPPARRWLHTAVYDSFRSRMLVFGGDAGTFTSGIANQNDVWELTLPAVGTPTWSPLSPAAPLGAPPVRANQTAVFDAANHRMVLFGGIDATVLDDAWALDVDATSDGTWIPLSSSGLPRWTHSAIYDPVGQRMLVFGGQDNSTRQNDVLALSLPANASSSAWSTLISSAASPVAARSAHTAVYDSLNRRMVVFGGDVFGPPSDEVWLLPLAGTPAFSLAAPAGAPATARYSHSAIYDPVFERMVVFSGDDGSLAPIDDLAWSLGF